MVQIGVKADPRTGCKFFAEGDRMHPHRLCDSFQCQRLREVPVHVIHRRKKHIVMVQRRAVKAAVIDDLAAQRQDRRLCVQTVRTKPALRQLPFQPGKAILRHGKAQILRHALPQPGGKLRRKDGGKFQHMTTVDAAGAEIVQCEGRHKHTCSPGQCIVPPIHRHVQNTGGNNNDLHIEMHVHRAFHAVMCGDTHLSVQQFFRFVLLVESSSHSVLRSSSAKF